MSVFSGLRARYRVAAGPLRAERRLELVLLVLALLVLLQLLWMALRAAMPPSVLPIPPAADSLAVRAGIATGAVSTEQRALVTGRPLFWEPRRPSGTALAQAGELEAGNPAKALRDLDVTGVYGSGSSGGAIVMYKGSERRLAVGDELDGWRLDRVDGDEVRWMSAGREDIRTLRPRPVTAQAPMPESASARSAVRAEAAQVASQAIQGAQNTAQAGRPRTLSTGSLPPRSTAATANGK